MTRVAVVTDSTVCLPPELVSLHGIGVVPLRFVLEGASYLDGVEITADDIYRMLPQVKTLPTTSAPSPSDYYAAIARASVSHEAVLVITIASKFSGMHLSATTAAATARDLLKNVDVQVLDSGTAAGAQGLVVLAAARAAGRGEDMESVLSAARSVMERVELVAFLDTLYYIARSGRVPMAIHWANVVVRVNPLFRIEPMSGEANTVRVARGRQSAERQLLEIVRRHVGARKLHGIVLHSYRRAEGELLRDRILSAFDCEELHVSDFTPAMGIHTGPGVLGLAYYAA